MHIFTVVFCGVFQVPLTYSVTSASPSSYLAIPLHICVHPQAFALSSREQCSTSMYIILPSQLRYKCLCISKAVDEICVSAGYFMLPDIHTVHYEGFYLFTCRFFLHYVVTLSPWKVSYLSTANMLQMCFKSHYRFMRYLCSCICFGMEKSDLHPVGNSQQKGL